MYKYYTILAFFLLIGVGYIFILSLKYLKNISDSLKYNVFLIKGNKIYQLKNDEFAKEKDDSLDESITNTGEPLDTSYKSEIPFFNNFYDGN